jgi:hypothetical protein
LKLKWVEIADVPEQSRFQTLSDVLSKNGIENQLEFISVNEIDRDESASESRAIDLETVLTNAKKDFGQIRIGGSLRSAVPKVVENFPASLLWLKAADALVPITNDGKTTWWPRNYFEQGFQRAFVKDIKNVDLSGAVFIVGATIEARAAIGALARMGFDRFSIADRDDDACEEFVRELTRSFLGLRVQAIQRNHITQLPAIHSAAINTLAVGQDEGMHAELAYFNFLKNNGIWMDMSLYAISQELEVEARTVGATVESGARILAWTDALWAADTLNCQLNVNELSDLYAQNIPVDS